MRQETSAARTRGAYDAVAAGYADLLPDLRAEAPLDLAMLDEFLRIVLAGDGPVIDVGCGTGRVAAHLSARGAPVVGIDLSPKMVATAHAAHPGIPFVVGSAEALPLPDACADGVLAWYSLIHTPPAALPRVAGELRRVAAPGAPLLTAFQAGAGEAVELTRAYGQAVDLTTFRHDPGHLASALGAAGFEVRARLDRAPQGHERQPQTVLLARAT